MEFFKSILRGGEGGEEESKSQGQGQGQGDEENEVSTLVEEQQLISAELFNTLRQRQYTAPYVPVTASFQGKFIDTRKQRENEKQFNINQIMAYIGVVTDTTKGSTPPSLLVEQPTKTLKRKKTEAEVEVLPAKTKPSMVAVQPLVPIASYTGEDIQIDGKSLELSTRLPKQALPTEIKDIYWLNNRKQFVGFITEYLNSKYRDEIDHVTEQTCDTIFGNNDSQDFSLLTHQKIIRDYMNLFTPYRGLLIYHGLGLGKTCTSIAIAESMKSTKEIIVMAPAFLLDSYRTQLKKCGDIMYRKNQHWEWIPLPDNLPNRDHIIDVFSKVLSIRKPDLIKFVNKNKQDKGVFLINVNKPSNYPLLQPKEQERLNTRLSEQIDLMIAGKYTIFSYNGLNRRKYEEFTTKYAPEGSKNMFDNKVIIIDEAHNLVSRIINKLDIQKPNANANETSINKNLLPSKKEQEDAVKKLSIELASLFTDLLKMYEEKYQNQGAELAVLNSTIHNKEKQINAFFKKQTTYQLLTDKERKQLKTEISNLDFLNKIIARLQSSNELHIQLKSPPPLSLQIYNDLMTAKNARVVMLSGTPIINRAHEMGIMFNMLRGSVKTWKYKFAKKLTDAQVELVMKLRLDIDFFQYDATTGILTITRNPFGFMNMFKENEGYTGMSNNTLFTQNKFFTTDEEFIKSFQDRLTKKQKEGLPKFELIEKVERKLLPDTSEKFNELYIQDDRGKISLKDKKRLEVRLLGLTSFFTTLQQGLLPDFDKEKDIEVVDCVMPTYQYSIYKVMNEKEEKMSRNQGQKAAATDKDSSTFKVFTRLICDYAVPNRPYPGDYRDGAKKNEEEPENWLQDVLEKDNASNDNMDTINDADADVDQLIEEAGGKGYSDAVQDTLRNMVNNKEEYFSLNNLKDKYSPKYYAIITNIKSQSNVGLNLVYSFFKTLEGLTFLGYAMQFNGFVKFQVRNSRILLNGLTQDKWSKEDIKKPKFAIYEGDKDERRVIQSIYNGEWSSLNEDLKNELTILFNENRNEHSTEEPNNNNFGEIIKVLMISSSGSEGINLNNTRYVHIMEPHWHHVRVEQVIGRARRLCSHRNLPPEFRNVKVYLYVMVFNPSTMEQIKSKHKNRKALKTTDLQLLDIMKEKENISNILIQAMKESAFDCNLYSSSTKVDCLVFNDNEMSKNSMTDYAYNPDFTVDTDFKSLKKTTSGKRVRYKVDGQLYIAVQLDNGDYELYTNEEPYTKLEPSLIVKASELEDR